MTPVLLSALRRISRKQWSALGLSVALGGLLVAVLFAALRPTTASAAEAAVYACNQTGLNNALAAGGSASFSCGAVTTVTVSGRKLVNKNVSLDGGNKLILSGGSVTGVFTVAAGVHLSLLNLTLRDASVNDFGGDIYNHGVVNITSSQFFSNFAEGGGAALYNAAGASAVISDATFEENFGEGGAILNGGVDTTGTATLHVINSLFGLNEAAAGAAIANIDGPATVAGSEFALNAAYDGGAIFDEADLQVDSSQFYINGAFLFAPQGPRPLTQQPSGSVRGGGAIYVAEGASAVVAGTFFTDNVSQDAGGAILYGTLPLDSNVLLPPGGLSIVGSSFDSNCTSGAGGALSTSETTTVADSRFTDNTAFAPGCSLLAAQSGSFSKLPAAVTAPAGGPPIGLSGAGGAIFNDGLLTLDGGFFEENTASVSTVGGGGAIANWEFANLQVDNSHFMSNTAQQDGGAIFNNFNGLATVVASDFTANGVLTDSGGAVANLGAFTVTNSTFRDNGGAPAGGDLGGGGGAIFSNNGALEASGLASPNGPAANAPPPNAGGQPQRPQLLLIDNHLTVDHDTFIANFSTHEGGALDAGSSTIIASTFTSNTARFGGAINVLSDSLTISASTFNANAIVHTSEGAARQGGAIDSNGEAFRVLNSTFFGNIANTGGQGGAIYVEGGAMAITNSTFLSNTAVDPGAGGAFAFNAHLVAHNLLIAFNSGQNCQDAMTLNAHDIDYPGSSCSSSALHADPRALGLGNNGGPTLTSLLLPASPAINAGDNSGCPGTDQRGAHRPVGAACDIGAFEFGGLVPYLWLPLMFK